MSRPLNRSGWEPKALSLRVFGARLGTQVRGNAYDVASFPEAPTVLDTFGDTADAGDARFQHGHPAQTWMRGILGAAA
ncbi:hypothetical protein ACWEOW_02110 [Monashia sp. NPDC004114]